MADLANCIAMMDEGVGRVGQIIPQMPAPEARLCRLMLMLGGTIERELESILKPHKLNHSEFLTLMILYSRPDGSSTPGELCEYATQGASKEDRRRVLIRITPAGRRFVQKMLPPMFPQVGTMFAGFSNADKRQLDRLLRKLAGNLDQLGEHRLP